MNETEKFLTKNCSVCFEGMTLLRTGRFFLAALIMSACVPHLVLAHVIVTEIMYDLKSGADGGREWIEVFNAGITTVNLSTWKLFENGTNHKIAIVVGSDTLAPNSYAIIADNAEKFKADWPQFGGQLFDSAFSLSNEGETLALRLPAQAGNASSTDIDTASYQSSAGAKGDGNSLNRLPAQAGASTGVSLIPRSPSPGAAMSATAIPPPPPKEVAVKTPKTKKGKSKKTTTSPVTANNVNTVETLPEGPIADIPAASTEVAAAAATSKSSLVWWLGAFGIAAFAAGSLFVAQRFGKREWDIVEDSVEEKGG